MAYENSSRKPADSVTPAGAGVLADKLAADKKESDLRRVFATLKRLAVRGDIDAIRELLNRTLGKARIADNMLSQQGFHTLCRR